MKSVKAIHSPPREPSWPLGIDDVLDRHGDLLQRSATRWHRGQTVVGNSDHNDILWCPGASEKSRDFADHNGNAAIGGSLLQLSLTEKCDPITIGREERESPAFGVGNGHAVKLVEAAGVKVGHTVLGRDIGEYLPSGERTTAWELLTASSCRGGKAMLNGVTPLPELAGRSFSSWTKKETVTSNARMTAAIAIRAAEDRLFWGDSCEMAECDSQPSCSFTS